MAKKSNVNFGLGDISRGKVPDDLPDDRVAEEKRAIERDHAMHEAAHWKAMAALRRASFQQDITERKNYATKIFWLVTVWLVLVFLLLVASGLKTANSASAFHFELSDKVLLAIVTGTTVDVIGLFAIVANYLFYKPSIRSKRPSRKHRHPDG